jgi:RNA polymerase sigma-70 factor (ECF subfamily)
MDHGASSYRRYLNGDEEAFHEIVKEYFDNLVFFIDRYVNDHAAAEDLALDAFTQLVVNKHRYDFRVSLKTYLFMIGRSRALDYIKHRRKLPTVDLSEVNQATDEPSLEDMLLADERKRILNKALAQLKEEMQLVVHLVYFEGLSPEEAAKVLKKNRKQIYNLLYRAKTTLRTILGEEELL